MFWRQPWGSKGWDRGWNDIWLDPYCHPAFPRVLTEHLLCTGAQPSIVQESEEEGVSPATRQHLPPPFSGPQFPHMPNGDNTCTFPSSLAFVSSRQLTDVKALCPP